MKIGLEELDAEILIEIFEALRRGKQVNYEKEVENWVKVIEI